MICAACGEWADAPVVEDSHLVCAQCGHREPFTLLPMFAVTGPSGTGKSTVCRGLGELLGDRAVVLEQDLLWIGAMHDSADDFGSFRQTWLRMAATINQSGRPVVLCGTVAPPQLERRPERVLFSEIHYLTLVADDDVLEKRLRARPTWRGWDNDTRITDMLAFNTWMKTNASLTSPPMTLLDTTTATPAETTTAVATWLLSHLNARVPGSGS
jgi:predicted kinase